MPLYEFTCRECGERFDRLQRVGDPLPVCPSCDRSRVTRMISVISGLGSSSSGTPAALSGGCGCGGACACGR
jgi:putative FmdB family regulatory protein